MEYDFPEVKHVVLDEVHNFEQPRGTESWYEKAEYLVQQHDPNRPGYLWCFIDLNQKNHTFPSGIPSIRQRQPEFRLRKVIRNSAKIFKHAKRYLERDILNDDVELGHDFVGEGVKMIKYSKSETSQLDVLSTTLRKLLKDGYTKGDIAVLFSKKDCIPPLEEISRKLNLFHWYSARDNNSEGLVISTVLKYSGLDRPVVLLVDVHGCIPLSRMRYPFAFCAVTRAMVKLVIIKCTD